jgi:hypothetical protein
VFLYFFKKLFLISAYQNNLKTQKKNNLKQRKKIKIIKKIYFFKSTFETQKQTGFNETWLKRYVKTATQKLCFKLNFLVAP